jgi:hypothetical protein
MIHQPSNVMFGWIGSLKGLGGVRKGRFLGRLNGLRPGFRRSSAGHPAAQSPIIGKARKEGKVVWFVVLLLLLLLLVLAAGLAGLRGGRGSPQDSVLP